MDYRRSLRKLPQQLVVLLERPSLCFLKGRVICVARIRMSRGLLLHESSHLCLLIRGQLLEFFNDFYSAHIVKVLLRRPTGKPPFMRPNSICTRAQVV